MGKKILVLEDEPAARAPLADVLEIEGHTVYAYESAEAAAHHLMETDCDVAVIDVKLPGRFGDDYARELGEKRPTARIIFLTGEYKLDDLKEKVPSALCLSKPVDMDVLLALINAA